MSNNYTGAPTEVDRQHDGQDYTDGDLLLPQLVAHLREHRARLRDEWASRIRDAHLLEAMTPQEMAAETTSVYDNYVEVLETGSVEALQHYARDLSERIIPRGVETHEGSMRTSPPRTASPTLSRSVSSMSVSG